MGAGKKSHQINGEELLIDPQLIIFIHCFPFQNVGYSCMQCCTNSFDTSLRCPSYRMKRTPLLDLLHWWWGKPFCNFETLIMIEPQICSSLSWTCHCFVFQIFSYNFTLFQLQLFFTTVFSTMSLRIFLPRNTFSMHSQFIYHTQFLSYYAVLIICKRYCPTHYIFYNSSIADFYTMRSMEIAIDSDGTGELRWYSKILYFLRK